ncbi:TPA: hypothetical protein ACL4BH_000411, partial [Streptococcus pneumoniae]
TDFYRPEYQKRKDEICPFSSLAFLQPTTVDKEPKKTGLLRSFKVLLYENQRIKSTSFIFDFRREELFNCA